MARDSKIKSNKPEYRRSKRIEMATKKKQVADSDSDDGDESNSDDDEMDVHEYRKFLSQIFPSKHLSNKIKAGEKLKKAAEEFDDEPSPTKKGSTKSKNTLVFFSPFEGLFKLLHFTADFLAYFQPSLRVPH